MISEEGTEVTLREVALTQRGVIDSRNGEVRFQMYREDATRRIVGMQRGRKVAARV